MFDEQKLYGSMESAGIEHSLAQELARMVRQDQNQYNTTNKIHFAVESALMKKQAVAEAARYNLKRAIVDLGPSGYPFEEYIARLFTVYGYSTQTNQMLQGKCVIQEVDVVAKRGKKHFMIECKHHHYPGAKTNLKVAMYTYARFLDVSEVWWQQDIMGDHQFGAWLVTNTKVTQHAIAYANCMNMKVLAWHYPKNKGLNELIEAKQLYPVTVIPNLTASEKKLLIKNHYITLQDLLSHDVSQIRKATKLKREVVDHLVHVAGEVLTTI